MDLRRVCGWSLLLGLTLLPGLSIAAGKCERLVVTGSPDAPPYLWQDPQNPKHLVGASADLLQHVAGELGIKVELLYAGKRSQALDEVRSGRMDMLADAPLMVSELEKSGLHPPTAAGKTIIWSGPATTRYWSTTKRRTFAVIPAPCRKKARITPSFDTFCRAAIDPVAHAQSDPGLPEVAAE